MVTHFFSLQGNLDENCLSISWPARILNKIKHGHLDQLQAALSPNLPMLDFIHGVHNTLDVILSSTACLRAHRSGHLHSGTISNKFQAQIENNAGLHTSCCVYFVVVKFCLSSSVGLATKHTQGFRSAILQRSFIRQISSVTVRTVHRQDHGIATQR